MRRDWEAVRILLDVSERLSGHPNLKGLREDALQDLNDLATSPPEVMYPIEEDSSAEGVFVDDVGPNDDGVPVAIGRRKL